MNRGGTVGSRRRELRENYSKKCRGEETVSGALEEEW